MGFEDSQDALNASTMVSKAALFGDEDEEVDDENGTKKKEKTFLEWLFGWILDPITAIIDGIISLVKFVMNAIKFCINLPWCIKWYIFYMIGTILYLPLSLFFMFFGLQKIEKKIWKAKRQLHDLIFCYTGYYIIGYSDEIRDGCFFETIKKRTCPTASLPNAGLSDILAEFMRGIFSFSYIGVVTALSFFFFFLWFIYYFVKPLFVRLYAFIMSYTKQKADEVSAKMSDLKKDASKNMSNFKNTASANISNINSRVSEAAEKVSKPLLENKTPTSGFLNPSSPLLNPLSNKVDESNTLLSADLTKVVV